MEAATLLHDATVEPQAVPGRLLLPILEWSSVQDEPELRLKWAALLANAATPDSNKIFPAFAEILRQLTPVHVRILDWMYAMRSYPVQNSIPYHPDVKRKTIEETFTLQPADYALLVTDMERLQLIEPRRDIPNMDDGEVDGDYLLRLIVARWNSRIKYNSINFTALGLRFMEACQPPTRVDKSA